jgi:hypothetical protein
MDAKVLNGAARRDSLPLDVSPCSLVRAVHYLEKPAVSLYLTYNTSELEGVICSEHEISSYDPTLYDILKDSNLEPKTRLTLALLPFVFSS